MVSADQLDTSVVAVENGSVNVSDGSPFKMVDCQPATVAAIDVLESVLNSSTAVVAVSKLVETAPPKSKSRNESSQLLDVS